MNEYRLFKDIDIGNSFPDIDNSLIYEGITPHSVNLYMDTAALPAPACARAQGFNLRT